MSQTPPPERTQPPPSADRLSGLSLGQPFGVPLRLSTSWFVGAAIIAWIFAPVVERWLLLESPWTLIVGATFAVLLGLSVLAHEMAHAVMAQHFGLKVRSMTIHLIGGVTAMEAETKRPWVDFTIAVVGPLTSLLVGGVAWLGYLLAPEGTVFSFVAWQLTAANLIVGVLNLVPALPLDGGRLLRDVVWAASGREYLGTVVAGWTGRGFAVVVALLAVLPVLLGRPDVIWLVWGLILAGFIWVEASRSLKYAGMSRAITVLSVSDLVRPVVLVAHDTPLATAMSLPRDERAALVVTDAHGDVAGVVRPEAAAAVPVERRPWVPVSSVALTAEEATRLSPDLAGQPLIEALTTYPAEVHVVEDQQGTVYGVVVTADVENALAARRTKS
ncbi:MAG: site-2 protease family protein [Actinomycetes bacterium]